MLVGSWLACSTLVEAGVAGSARRGAAKCHLKARETLKATAAAVCYYDGVST